MAKTRWFVKAAFADYEVGDVIEDARIAAEHADYVLRLSDDPAIEPTKAEARAEGKPAATEAREAVGLPPGPVEDGKPKAAAPRTTTHRLNG